MKGLHVFAAVGAASALAFTAPAGAALAQSVDANAVVSSDHGNWTLKEREDWLKDRLSVAHNDGSVDDSEFDRVQHEIDRIHDAEDHMRGDHDGQLTDNETTVLEARLDGVAGQIHWLHEDRFRKPW
jgi:hypothetical protein